MGTWVLIDVGDLCDTSSRFCSGLGTYDLDPKPKPVDLPMEAVTKASRCLMAEVSMLESKSGLLTGELGASPRGSIGSRETISCTQNRAVQAIGASGELF